jgi:putative transposase
VPVDPVQDRRDLFGPDHQPCGLAVLPFQSEPRTQYWLWRAVDQDGFVLDILVQERRNEQAAVAFLRRVLAAAGEPRVIVTDKLARYVPAGRRVLPTTEHRRHKRLNNGAENSHVPVRKRERVL